MGGAVRDRLLGREDVDDTDFLVRGIEPHELEAILSRHGTWSHVGRAFGVYKFTPHDERSPVDIVLPRSESSTGVGHRDFEVRFDWTLPVEADLGRRDFTINAIAEEVPSGRVVDPYGGQEDIGRRVLRMIFPRAFDEDPLRILRGARFAARFDFSIDRSTRAAMTAAAGLLSTVSAERVQYELSRVLLQCDRPSRALDLLHETGSLAAWLPELERCAGVTQNEYHPDDVYWHSMKTCDASRRDRLVVRWAALLHDVGKVDTRQELHDGETSRVVFYGHEVVGAEMAATILQRLRYASDFVGACKHLVREHMYRYESSWKPSTVRRFMRRVGDASMEDLLDLREADCKSRHLSGELSALKELRERVSAERRAHTILTIRDLAVDGDDVMHALHAEPGPDVGAHLDALLERVTDDPSLNTRENLLKLLKEKAGET